MHQEEELKRFMKSLKYFDSDIESANKYSKDGFQFSVFELMFSMAIISFKCLFLIKCLFVKLTEHHQYLHYLSYYLDYTKHSLIYRQVLREKENPYQVRKIVINRKAV